MDFPVACKGVCAGGREGERERDRERESSGARSPELFKNELYIIA